MAKRDVELVIRAKDEARKAVDGIAASLDKLAASQDKVKAGADKTGTSLAGLKNVSAELQAKLQSLTALQKVASEFERASSAANRLESELKETSSDLGKYQAEAQRAAINTAKLRTEATAAAAAIQAEQAAVTASRAALTNVNRELRTAETAHRKLGGAIKQTTAPNAELRAEYTRQISALVTLRATQEKSAASLALHRGRLSELRTAVTQTRGALKTAETAERRFGLEAEKAAASLKKQEAALVGSRGDLQQIAGLANEVSGALGGVAVTQDAVAVASRTAAAELDRVSQALERQKTSAGGRAAAGPAAAATANFKAQRVELENLSRSYRAFQQRATELGRQLRNTQNPSVELRAEFARMRDAARQAKEQFFAQGQALSVLRGTANTSLSTFNARVNQLTAETTEARAAQAGFLGTLRQVAAQFFQTGTAAQQTGAGMRTAAAGANQLRAGFAGVTGEGRRSLSLLQRFRGEIISLGVAYLGLFGIIRQFSGVIDVIRTLEATQNRLSAAFGQNQAIVQSEMRFLRREAIRLGISFDVLANSYSSFAVSARLSGFTLDGIRSVFLSVAEAARVNKLSTEDMNGVFQALIQIIQKGRVQAEELRRQLGNRLPGAFQIMANAITEGDTALLEFQLRSGQLVGDEATLLKFAGALTEAFGAQLPAALGTVIAEMGRFETHLFFARERVANEFVGPFITALQELNVFFQSEDGVKFFEGLGGAAAKVTEFLVVIIKNFKLLIAAGTLFIGLKLIPTFTGLARNIRKGGLAFRASTTAMRGNTAAAASLVGAQRVIQVAGTQTTAVIERLRLSLLGIAPASAVARGGLTAMAGTLAFVGRGVALLTGLFRGLWLAIGGLPGIILTGLTFALTGWLTQTDAANVAISEHERILGIIIDQYSTLQSLTEGWAGAIEGLTLLEAENNLEALQDRLTALRNEASQLVNSDLTFRGLTSIFSPREAREGLRAIRDLVEEYRLGEITATAFQQALSDIGTDTTNQAVRDLATELQGMTEDATGLELAITQADIVIKAFSESLNDVETATIGAAAAMDDLVDPIETAEQEANRLQLTIDALKELIPAFDSELRRMEGLNAIKDALAEADLSLQDWITHWRELIPLVSAALIEVNKVVAADFGFSGTNGVQEAFDLLRRLEGFQPVGTFDVNAFRGGFGSDTITLSDGTIQAVTDGMSISLEDAQRDLFRRIEEFQTVIIGQIGEQRFNVFNPAQQAALTSIAFNYGSLPGRILDAVRTGTGEEIANAIRGLSGDNDGINARRRGIEAEPFGGHNRDLILANQEILDQEEELRQSTRDQIADNDHAIAQQQLINTGLERQAAINDAIRDAREDNASITEEEIALIAEQTGELFDLQNAEKIRNAEKTAAMEAVNRLLAIQRSLEESIETLRDRGTEEAIAEADRLEAQLTEVRVELQTAVQEATALAEALGDEQMVANLRNIALAAKDAADQMTYLGLSTEQVGQLGTSFVNGFVNFIDKAAQSIAEAVNGTKTWGEALSDVRDNFLQFAADFLREIARMIIQQAIMNALKAAFSGGGGIGAAFVSAFHTGGIAGQHKAVRGVHPGVFANAVRMHSGGMPGIRPNEVPIIAERGEEILAKGDPRNAANGGGAGGGVKIVNAIDASDMLSEALASTSGEKVFLNHIRANSRKVRSAMGG